MKGVDCRAARQEAERIVAEGTKSEATELSLEYLRICELPLAFRQLTGALKKLVLAECYRLTDLSALSGLTGLQSLDLSGCWQLTDLCALSGLIGLQNLDLNGCGQLTNLSALSGLTGLQSINLHACGQLTDLSALSEFTELRSLHLSGYEQLTDLSALSGLTGLQNLDLSFCMQLTDLSALSGITGLQSLNLSGCWQLTDLSALSGLVGLRSLNLSHCHELTDLSALSGLTGLQSLDLGDCWELTDLGVLHWLNRLQRLHLGNCEELTDLGALSGLTGLQNLDLNGCGQLTNLSAFSGLTGLQSLDLEGCWQLTDLGALSGLTGLQNLDLSGCNQLTNLSALSGLTGLQNLDLNGCGQLTNLSALSGLTGLQNLDLNGCGQLTELSALSRLTGLQKLSITLGAQQTDLSALSGLTGLQSLVMSCCWQLTDLGVLSGLTGLQNLNLSHCAQLTDLSALSGLTGLQSLNLSYCAQLTDLNALSALTGLQSLNLSYCAQLTDLNALSALTGLQSLDLSNCEKLTDLSALSGLTGLQSLHIGHLPGPVHLGSAAELMHLKNIQCQGTALDLSEPAQLFRGFPRLGYLSVGEFVGAPRELVSGWRTSCLSAIELWYLDLQTSGATPITDVKMFLLGNGRVGKTQIVRRLQGQEFDGTVASTHGVDISRFPLLAKTSARPELFANTWDFGGQDIYLGTHGLFLDDRAIYLLVWTPAKENDDSLVENSVQMRDRRLDYWLDYVRSLVGPRAPVIVVQSQCDRESQVVEAPMAPDHGFEWLQRTACSAADSDAGMERLWPLLHGAARLLRERHGEVMLPASWVAVGQDLRERQLRGMRVMPIAEFMALCSERGVGAPSATLDYLHRSGSVFCAPKVFGGDVVLDQAWALDGVYALLHRDSVLPALKRARGHFTREWLGTLLWNINYTVEEQEHFLSLMLSCQVCFEVADGHYIAPDYLPDRAEAKRRIDAVWRDSAVTVSAELRYEFLHDGVKRGLLCALGNAAGLDAVYWRHGVCFYDTEQSVTVLVECRYPDNDRAGSVAVEISGRAAQDYLDKTVKSICDGIRIGRPPKIVDSQSKAAGAPEPVRYRADEGSAQEPPPFAHIRSGLLPSQPGVLPVVHVSYGWSDASIGLVDKFEAALKGQCNWRRDRDSIRPGDWISKFIDEIGRSPCALVIVSEKYLKSKYCMRELLLLYQASQGDKAQLLNRIVPVLLPDAKIDSELERLACARYWIDKRKAIETARKGMDLSSLGASTLQTLVMIEDFKNHVVDMLAWVVDVLMPRAGLGNDGPVVDAAVKLIQQRLAQHPQIP